MTLANSLIGASALRRLALLAAAALLLAVAPLAGIASADDVDVTDAEDAELGTIQVRDGDDLIPSIRFAGTGREDTARLISGDPTDFAAQFETGTVVLARGDDYPDALAGSYVGGQEAAPILLTPTDFVHPNLELSLEHWSGGDASTIEIVILGGTAAISAEVETELENDGYTVDRRGGPTRVHTAAEVAMAYDPADVGELDGMRTAIVASAENFPDALVAGALSASNQFPLLLTWQDDLPDVTADALDDLGIEQAIIAGGTVAVSSGVETELDGLLGADNVRRVSGGNRFATAVAFADMAVDELGFSEEHINLATGRNFPDALALGPHAGLDYIGPSPILLTDLAMPPETGAELESLGDCGFQSLHVAGGNAAISDAIEQQAREALTTDDDCPLLSAALTGDKEVPDPGDPDGAGVAFVVADATAAQVCVDLSVDLDEAAAAAHIHTGAEGVPGGVVITLPTPDADGFASGCAGPDDGIDEDIVTDIVANPDAYYVNVHTETFGGGAIRGQLDAVPLAASMDGAQEVPVPGDEDGFGAALLAADPANDVVCYDMFVADIEPAAAAHIHEGEVGVPGGIVVTLETPDADGVAIGCSEPDVPATTDIQDIVDDVPGYYVNVHNADFPGGAVRGQLEAL